MSEVWIVFDGDHSIVEVCSRGEWAVDKVYRMQQHHPGAFFYWERYSVL